MSGGFSREALRPVKAAGVVLAVAVMAAVVLPGWVRVASAAGSAAFDWTPDAPCAECHLTQAGSAGDAASGRVADAAESEEVDKGDAIAATADKADADADADAGAADVADTSSTDAAEQDGAPDAATPLAQSHMAMGLECTFCHNDEEGLVKAHSKIKGDDPLQAAEKIKRLKRSEVDVSGCVSCHDKGALTEAAEGLDVLKDNNGTIVNPHDLPAAGNHDQTVQCVSCHAMHDAESAPAEVALAVCFECHHTAVFECGTCHED